MWRRPEYEETFDNLVMKRVLGLFKPDESDTVYLDEEYLRQQGIFEQVLAHEHMHVDLTTSTTIGHACMLLGAPPLRNQRDLFEVFCGLMALSWEAQEAAATMVEWSVAQSSKKNPRFEEFYDSLPAKYQEAFDLFNSITQILLPPYNYWMKPVASNALGQFALNTDILMRIAVWLEGEPSTAELVVGYMNSDEGHPQKRIRKLLKALAEPLSSKRRRSCREIAKRLKSWADTEIFLKYPHLGMPGGTFVVGKLSKEQIMLMNDSLNQIFLRYFVDQTELPIGAFHAAEAGAQFDIAAEQLRKKFGIGFRRNDTTGDIGARAKFLPRIKKLPN